MNNLELKGIKGKIQHFIAPIISYMSEHFCPKHRKIKIKKHFKKI